MNSFVFAMEQEGGKYMNLETWTLLLNCMIGILFVCFGGFEVLNAAW